MEQHHKEKTVLVAEKCKIVKGISDTHRDYTRHVLPIILHFSFITKSTGVFSLVFLLILYEGRSIYSTTAAYTSQKNSPIIL